MIIDLSHWNTDGYPLQRGHLQGVQACWAKATEGRSFRDRQYRHHLQACEAAGVPFGAYLFANPGASVAEQLGNFTAVVQTVGFGQLPPMLDAEDGRFQGDASPMLLELLKGLQRITGRRPLFYSYRLWIRQHVGPRGAALADYPLWIARYPTGATDPDPARLKAPQAPWPWSSWTLWQYTSKGRLPGRPDNIDKNVPAAADTIANMLAPGWPDEQEPFDMLTPDQQTKLANDAALSAKAALVAADAAAKAAQAAAEARLLGYEQQQRMAALLDHIEQTNGKAVDSDRGQSQALADASELVEQTAQLVERAAELVAEAHTDEQ